MCLCDLCRGSNTSAPTLTATVYLAPQAWCGVHHAHGPHRWVMPSNLYADCPGSTCVGEDQ